MIERERESRIVCAAKYVSVGQRRNHSLASREIWPRPGARPPLADSIVTNRFDRREVVPTTPQQLPCLTCYHPAMQESLLKTAAAAGATCAVARRFEMRRQASPEMVVRKMAALRQSLRGWWSERKDGLP